MRGEWHDAPLMMTSFYAASIGHTLLLGRHLLWSQKVWSVVYSLVLSAHTTLKSLVLYLLVRRRSLLPCRARGQLKCTTSRKCYHVNKFLLSKVAFWRGRMNLTKDSDFTHWCSGVEFSVLAYICHTVINDHDFHHVSSSTFTVSTVLCSSTRAVRNILTSRGPQCDNS